jgi:hypothetical protein
MIQLYIIDQLLNIAIAIQDYSITRVGTNSTNLDKLWVVDGDQAKFKADYPEAKDYYEGDWFLNWYPNAVGDTPLEKYLNAINGFSMNNPPKWNNILPALASSSLFLKILTTQNPNAFSALQTVVQYRNIELFQVLAKATVEAIPGGLTEAEFQELNTILIQNNFPLIK